jgi:formylglycine-generating enzyme required for sulfatase activity
MTRARVAALVATLAALAGTSACSRPGTGPARESVRFAAGTFRVGCDPARSACAPGDPPPRDLSLPAFALDRDEVAAAEYDACIAAGACPEARKASTTCNLGVPGRERHPMNCTTAAHARAFCAWSGARLPTEAEWERAARGTDGRSWPWGEEPPDCARAVFRGCAQGTAEAGRRPAGTTPEGVRDLAGNVWEWVTTSDGRESGRGGAFDLAATDLRPWVPIGVAAGQRSNNAGIRCARSTD